MVRMVTLDFARFSQVNVHNASINFLKYYNSSVCQIKNINMPLSQINSIGTKWMTFLSVKKISG